MYRRITRVEKGRLTHDGAGVRLRRFIPTPDLPDFDPFLLFDEFKSDRPEDYLGGFPPHPHRGFETVTHLLAGRFRHEDSRGHRGELKEGDVQWMTAGKGIVHSEMPFQENGLLWGFQLWVNLPQNKKMVEPRYQDMPAERIPVVEKSDARVRVIAGEWNGARGVVETLHSVSDFEVQLQPEGVWQAPCPSENNAFVFVIEGDIDVGDPNDAARRSNVPRGVCGILGEGDAVFLTAGKKGARFLFLSGKRLEEPIARAGPFVMNTQAELQQAFLDYQQGRLG